MNRIKDLKYSIDSESIGIQLKHTYRSSSWMRGRSQCLALFIVPKLRRAFPLFLSHLTVSLIECNCIAV